MQKRKFHILSAATAGSLALAAVAITASSGTSPTLKHAALAARTESFPTVNLADCPILHPGYPTGGCVAQLQTDLNLIQGNHLAVDGTFGSVGSQTYQAVVAFQQAHGLSQDGVVGPATKQALGAAPPVPTSTVPPATTPVPAANGESTPEATTPSTTSPLDNSPAGDGGDSLDQGGVGPAVGCGGGAGVLGEVIGGPLGVAGGIICEVLGNAQPAY
jgi:Putative peptidoglycan binding domain